MGKLAQQIISLYGWESSFELRPRLVRGWIAQVIREFRKANCYVLCFHLEGGNIVTVDCSRTAKLPYRLGDTIQTQWGPRKVVSITSRQLTYQPREPYDC